MNKKIQHTVYTDRAWDNLYNRIEQDGLLQEITPEKRKSVPSYLKWVAVIAFVLGGLATYLLVHTDGPGNYYGLTTLNNEAGAFALVKTLEDGSVVYLANNAQIHYPESFLPDKREVYLEGTALFEVTGNRERPFYIETGSMIVKVVGTSFEIKSEDSSLFELSVRKGIVKISGKYNGRQVFVKAGETAVSTYNGLFSVYPTTGTDFYSRYTGRLRFKDENLEQIIGVINKNHPGTLLTIDPELRERKLTIAFAGNTPEEMAQLICLGLQLNYTVGNHTIRISE